MRLRLFVLLVFLLKAGYGLVSAPTALADAGSSGLELSELLVDPASPQVDSKDEFVELHNLGTSDEQLQNYSLQIGTHNYKLPSQTLAPYGYAVLTSDDSTWSLANAGGTITLLDSSATQVDTTTWPKAVTGASWMKSDDGTWDWSTTPTPGAANQFTETAPGQGSVATPETGYSEVDINELLPDPASPQTDAKDEFIEFYNPNPFPVGLEGYVIKTGANLTTSHILPAVTVPAGDYLAMKSADTKIALSNTGSSVALFDPSGAQVGDTITYPKAKTGDAWALIDDQWAWTTTPTPGEANLLTDPAVESATTAAAKSKAKSTTKTKAASSKTSKPKAAKATKAKAAKSGKTGAGLAGLQSPGGYWLLFALAGLTIAYVIYEFRYDLRNLYFRLRGYPTGGVEFGEYAEGRGSDRAGERPRGWQDYLRARLGSWAWLRRRRHQPDLHPESDIQTTLF